MRVQQRRRASGARRVLAAIAGVWLVAWAVFAMRHEAQVAHVLDHATGQMVHADRAIGEHTGNQSDYHATSPVDGDHDACGICSALHQAARPEALHAIVVRAPEGTPASWSIRARSEFANAEVYRLAPKTSPPPFAG